MSHVALAVVTLRLCTICTKTALKTGKGATRLAILNLASLPILGLNNRTVTLISIQHPRLLEGYVYILYIHTYILALIVSHSAHHIIIKNYYYSIHHIIIITIITCCDIKCILLNIITYYYIIITCSYNA